MMLGVLWSNQLKAGVDTSSQVAGECLANMQFQRDMRDSYKARKRSEVRQSGESSRRMAS
jgi:hypothetical protein